jgi:hypothetical protein
LSSTCSGPAVSSCKCVLRGCCPFEDNRRIYGEMVSTRGASFGDECDPEVTRDTGGLEGCRRLDHEFCAGEPFACAWTDLYDDIGRWSHLGAGFNGFGMIARQSSGTPKSRPASAATSARRSGTVGGASGVKGSPSTGMTCAARLGAATAMWKWSPGGIRATPASQRSARVQKSHESWGGDVSGKAEASGRLRLSGVAER